MKLAAVLGFVLIGCSVVDSLKSEKDNEVLPGRAGYASCIESIERIPKDDVTDLKSLRTTYKCSDVYEGNFSQVYDAIKGWQRKKCQTEIVVRPLEEGDPVCRYKVSYPLHVPSDDPKQSKEERREDEKCSKPVESMLIVELEKDGISCE